MSLKSKIVIFRVYNVNFYLKVYWNTVYTPHTVFRCELNVFKKKYTTIFEHYCLTSLISDLYLCDSLNFTEILVKY